MAVILVCRVHAASSVTVFHDLLVSVADGSQLSEAAVDARWATRVLRARFTITGREPIQRWTARPLNTDHPFAGSVRKMTLAAAFRLDGKTSSTEAAACTVPVAHGTDHAVSE